MPTMLRHIPTGEVYPFNADMAMRGDMEQFSTEEEKAPEQLPLEMEEPVVEEKPKPVQPVKVSKKPKDEPLNLDDL